MVAVGLELEEKRQLLQNLAARHGLDGMILTSLPAVAWFTGGADLHVARNTAEAVGAILVTADRLSVFTNSSEASRFEDEEFVDTPFEVIERPWHQSAVEQITRETRPLRLGTDDRVVAAAVAGTVYLGAEVAGLRRALTEAEVDRYREVGRLTGEAIETAARAVEPGLTEFQVAALLDRALLDRGVEPTVTLIAADERIRRFRHPIPTARRVEEACMLVTCARRDGLIAAATRIVHFGPLPADLRRRHLSVVNVDAALIRASRPGVTMGRLYELAVAAYAAQGFAGEELLHHQGGAIGYENREYLAVPGSEETVHAPQAFAWNPSISGTKSEDTYLIPSGYGSSGLDETAPECLTAGDGTWPVVTIAGSGLTLHRPDILVR